MRNCLAIDDPGNDDNNYNNFYLGKHDNNYDYSWIRITIVTMTYGNADDDQGYSHGND